MVSHFLRPSTGSTGRTEVQGGLTCSSYMMKPYRNGTNSPILPRDKIRGVGGT